MTSKLPLKRTPMAVAYVALIGAAVVALLPFYALLAAAMNPAGEWAGGVAGLWPTRWDGAALRTAWHEFGAWRALVNGLVIAVLSSGIGLVLCTLAAYGLVRKRFIGRYTLQVALVLAASVPPVAWIAATWRAAGLLHLWDSRVAVVLVLSAQPLAILLLRAYIRRLPSDMLDAARLDGLSDLAILRGIVAPLVRRGLVVAAVVQFLAAWNTLTIPMVLVDSPGKRTLTALAADLAQQAWLPWAPVASVALLNVLPALIVFVVFHRLLLTEASAWAEGKAWEA